MGKIDRLLMRVASGVLLAVGIFIGWQLHHAFQ